MRCFNIMKFLNKINLNDGSVFFTQWNGRWRKKATLIGIDKPLPANHFPLSRARATIGHSIVNWNGKLRPPTPLIFPNFHFKHSGKVKYAQVWRGRLYLANHPRHPHSRLQDVNCTWVTVSGIWPIWRVNTWQQPNAFSENFKNHWKTIETGENSQ